MSKIFLFTIFLMFAFSNNIKANECKYWLAQVDPNTEVDYEIDEQNPKNILKGIKCLLKLQGNKKEGLFSGATNDTVSNIFPQTTVEICALYYISYLFYVKWDHADGIALVGKDKKTNSSQSLKTAFASYRKWFKTVEKIGLEEARKQKLDPLAGSGVRWY